MTLIALIIGVVLIAAAIRDTHTTLFGALAADVPPFMVWAAAVFAVGAIGWIPGLKPVSRGLLALVIVVLILNNYQGIIQGLSMPVSSSVGSSSESAGVGSNIGGAIDLGDLIPTSGGPFAGGDFAGDWGMGGGSSPWILH